MTIPLTGTAIAAAPQVTISPMSLSFGNVPVGKTATQTFTISNTGNISLTVTKAAPPDSAVRRHQSDPGGPATGAG